MSNPSQDAVIDYFQDHAFDLLEEWMNKSQANYESVLGLFLEQHKHKDYLAFEGQMIDACWDKLRNQTNEDDLREDR